MIRCLPLLLLAGCVTVGFNDKTSGQVDKIVSEFHRLNDSIETVLGTKKGENMTTTQECGTCQFPTLDGACNVFRSMHRGAILKKLGMVYHEFVDPPPSSVMEVASTAVLQEQTQDSPAPVPVGPDWIFIFSTKDGMEFRMIVQGRSEADAAIKAWKQVNFVLQPWAVDKFDFRECQMKRPEK